MIEATLTRGRDTAQHRVVGTSYQGKVHLYVTPFNVEQLEVGMVIEVGGNYYRIYEDGRRGLRTWLVTREVVAAMALDSLIRRPALLPVGEAS